MCHYHQTGNIRWAVREIRESSEDLLALLDRKDLYLPFISRIKTEKRRQEWLSVRLLLKEIFGEEKEILYSGSGNPYFADKSYHLSISHTNGYVAVACAEDSPVGIDIEYISPRINQIRSRFMSDEEEGNLSTANRDIHLLLHWSAKETMFKWLGEENVDFKTCLHIQSFEPVLDILSTFPAFETKTGSHHNFLMYYITRPDYVLTFTS